MGQARLTGPAVAGALAILVLAVALGIVAGFGIRVRGGTPVAAPPDPLESPDGVAGAFSEVVRRTASGTHRIIATTCTGTGIGTAFAFGDGGMLVTSSRTVAGARSVVILTGERIVTARVAKIDAAAGLALLKPAAPVPGHTFGLGTRQLAPKDEVAAVGWTAQAHQPARGRSRATVGAITETGVSVDSPDGRLLVRRMTGVHDVGLAGSPVIGRDGLVLGMLVQTTDDQQGLLIAGLDTIADPLLGPTGLPPVMEPCVTAGGPRVVTTVGGTAPAAERTGLGQWFGALNSADWDRALGALTPALRREWTTERLRKEFGGSYAFNIATAAGIDGPGTQVSWVSLDPQRPCERRSARVTFEAESIKTFTPVGAAAPC